MAELVQLLVAGLTMGAVYAIVALGFTLIYAASDVVNFAQGEFVMLGGLVTVFLSAQGLPIALAASAAVLIAVAVGIILQKLAIERARGASPVNVIIITLGASIVIRGAAGLTFDRQYHSLQPFSGNEISTLFGAAVQAQSFWVLGGSIVMFAALGFFLKQTITGTALRASAANSFAAQLVGVNVRFMYLLAFGTSAALGAIAGILVTPITLTRFDIGTIFALKGFSAAVFGGLGSPLGAALGGLLLGVFEALAAGYVTSAYKDAVAFITLIAVLLFMPNGLLGGNRVDRV
jgi:branched-chain amino acid transport system permease protein